ncbi:MAG: glutamate-5-semialdehyde dehydrogenase [Firmicutes bacterium]|nr:glutamate-5-semialdehyde dehydrogenase [Bacillota bacterium]
MSSIHETTLQVKADSFSMAALPGDIRNKALQAIIDNLQSHRAAIFAENAEDLKRGEEAGLPQPIMKRLKFDEAKLADVCAGMEGLQSLPDPLFRTLLSRQLDEGLILKQVTCPIGVIGVIFESRPDALVQIAALCLKSGNCAILKGGSEAAHTNRILFDLIHEAGVSAGIPSGFLTLIENRADIDELLKCDDAIDLLIPRGSNAFVQYIMNNSKIPVMGHADGVCHIYVDKDADLDLALPVVLDAKTQYVAACNTVETLLVHQAVAPTFLPKLSAACCDAHVKLVGCPRSMEYIQGEPCTDADYRTEYLDYILTVRIVDDLDEAIAHINRYGSHHTDAILTESEEAAQRFMLLVDSAGVYQNCSTRFADGFRYGFGAEVGISTGKLHARGPVGLDGLVTYKYKLFGHGQIVGDYAEGRSSFHFKDL